MKKHYIIFASVLAGVILLDLLTKIFLYGVDSIFLPYIIGFRDAPLNTGAAWSFMSGHIWLFCVLAFIFIAAAIFVDFKLKAKRGLVYSLGLGFLLGGTIGNLIDRIALGGVRDFLFFEFWYTFPTFNFADVALTIGCILIAVYLVFLYKPPKKVVGAESGAKADSITALQNDSLKNKADSTQVTPALNDDLDDLDKISKENKEPVIGSNTKNSQKSGTKSATKKTAAPSRAMKEVSPKRPTDSGGKNENS